MKKRNKLVNKLENFLESLDDFVKEDLSEDDIPGNSEIDRIFRFFIKSFFFLIISFTLLILMCIPSLIIYIYTYFKNIGEKAVIDIALEKHEKSLIEEYGYLHIESYNYPNTFDYYSLRGFINEFLTYYNIHRATSTKEGTIQCGVGRRRSLGDIFLICKFYYPNCTIKEVLICLISLLNNKKITASYCFTINKFVFHTQNDNNNFNSNLEWLKGTDIKFKDIIKIYKYESYKKLEI